MTPVEVLATSRGANAEARDLWTCLWDLGCNHTHTHSQAHVPSTGASAVPPRLLATSDSKGLESAVSPLSQRRYLLIVMTVVLN